MDKVQELREQLRNDRSTEDRTDKPTIPDDNGTGSTSKDPGGLTTDIFAENGTSVQRLSGSSTGTRQPIRPINQSQKQPGNRARSVTPVNFGKRQPDRRSSEDNGTYWSDGTDIPASSIGGTAKPIRREGNLVTDESIPERTFTREPDLKAASATQKPETQGTTQPRKRGRPRKQGIIGLISPVEEIEDSPQFSKQAKQPFFKGKTFSQKEAKDTLEPLTEALLDDSMYMDQFLWAKIQDETKRPIWSNIDQQEAEVLAKVMLKGAQANPIVATGVRGLLEGKDYLDAFMIVGPRFQLTVQALKYSRELKRKEKREKRVL